jgi:hypothetical protein
VFENLQEVPRGLCESSTDGVESGHNSNVPGLDVYLPQCFCPQSRRDTTRTLTPEMLHGLDMSQLEEVIAAEIVFRRHKGRAPSGYHPKDAW